MTFKDIAKNDIRDAFLRVDEFADMHTIDGRTMPAIIDKSELLERIVNNAADTRMQLGRDGLYEAEMILYVAVEDYGARPKVGMMLLLDSRKQYRVLDVTEDRGLYAITLGTARI